MPELKEVFDMVSEKVEPDADAWTKQDHRHRGAMRNRKIGTIALVAAIAVTTPAAILATREPSETTIATDQTGPAEIATGFMDAYGAFDLDRAVSFLADDADVSELVGSIGSTDLGGPPGLRLAISYLEAVGYEQIDPSCVEESVGPSGGLFRCSFDLHLLRSDEIGRGPFGPAEIALSIVDGEIVRASSMSFDHEEAFSQQVWEPFAAWVSSRYPDYDRAMYKDESHSGARITERTIALWERLTERWAEEVANASRG